MPKDLVILQGKQQQCMHLLNESLVGECEYTIQPKGSFLCHVIDAKGSVFYRYLQINLF